MLVLVMGKFILCEITLSPCHEMKINTSPYEEGWMIKVKPSDPSELGSLMGAKEYTKFCEEEDASH